MTSVKCRSLSAVHVAWLIRVLALCAVALALIYIFSTNIQTSKPNLKTTMSSSSGVLSPSVDLEFPEVPANLSEFTQKPTVLQNSFAVGGVPNVFCQQVLPFDHSPFSTGPSGLHILFLHGMAFKSQTWVDPPMETLQTMGLYGHHAVACDLPGYGRTPSVPGNVDHVKFIEDLIEKLEMDKVFIVSPSMSGSYSLPYLVSKQSKLIGYIPVAPVMTERYTSYFPSIKTPTLIIFGDKDKNLGARSFENLGLLPNRKVILLENAGHPAYLDHPARFNNIVNNFMNLFKSSR